MTQEEYAAAMLLLDQIEEDQRIMTREIGHMTKSIESLEKKVQ